MIVFSFLNIDLTWKPKTTKKIETSLLLLLLLKKIGNARPGEGD